MLTVSEKKVFRNGRLSLLVPFDSLFCAFMFSSRRTECARGAACALKPGKYKKPLAKKSRYRWSKREEKWQKGRLPLFEMGRITGRCVQKALIIARASDNLITLILGILGLARA